MIQVKDRTALRAAFFRAISSYGFRVMEPPILQPAEPFLQLSGEAIKRRLFLTHDGEGREFCLRPDYTLPIALTYLKGRAHEQANYAYCGPVFRQRDGLEPDEFIQAGVESFGVAEREEADVATLRLVINFLVAEGIDQPDIWLGDVALFEALLNALHVSDATRRRLLQSFTDGSHFEEDLERLLSEVDGDDQTMAGLLTLVRKAGPEEAKAAVNDLLNLSGSREIHGRTIADIADRLIEKAADQKSGGLNEEERKLLRSFVSIEGTVDEAVVALGKLAKTFRIDLNPALEVFEKRLTLLRASGIATNTIRYKTAFHSRQIYYTGMVFEVHDSQGKVNKPLAVGGRYDGLLAAISGGKGQPAVGSAIWLDRLLEALS